MQIRDRYYNALSPGHIRGPWTEQEDLLLREVRTKISTATACLGLLVGQKIMTPYESCVGGPMILQLKRPRYYLGPMFL